MRRDGRGVDALGCGGLQRGSDLALQALLSEAVQIRQGGTQECVISACLFCVGSSRVIDQPTTADRHPTTGALRSDPSLGIARQSIPPPPPLCSQVPTAAMDQSLTKSVAGPSPWQAPPDYMAHSLVASFLSSELRWGAHVALVRLVSRDWRTTVDSVLPVLAPRTGVPLAKLAALCRRCTGLRVLRVQEPGGLLLISITHRMWPLNSVGLEFCAAVRSLGGATLLGCAQRMCLPSS